MHAPYIDYLVKLVECVARISLIFRMARYVSQGASMERLNAEDIMTANQVMQALRQHGRRVFGLMGQRSYREKAHPTGRDQQETNQKWRFKGIIK